MRIYGENGYLDTERIMRLRYPLIFIVGGRGTGKTYGMLKHAVENKIKFLFLRRTATQYDIISKKEMNPFKKLNIDNGWNITTAPISKQLGGFYHCEEVDGKIKIDGDAIGYMSALSTFSNLRGFSAEDVELIIFDEFIPEPHERLIKSEYKVFLNMYETVNRNRELEGREPCKLVALANSNTIGNPIFLGMRVVNKVEQLNHSKENLYKDDERGFAIISMKDSPISKRKNDTVLYKFAHDKDFESMALDNEFDMKYGLIKSQNLIEFRPVVNVGEICIYEKKDGSSFYVSSHTDGNVVTYMADEISLKKFRNKYLWIASAYMRDSIIFESEICEILLTKYIKF